VPCRKVILGSRHQTWHICTVC